MLDGQLLWPGRRARSEIRSSGYVLASGRSNLGNQYADPLVTTAQSCSWVGKFGGRIGSFWRLCRRTCLRGGRRSGVLRPHRNSALLMSFIFRTMRWDAHAGWCGSGATVEPLFADQMRRYWILISAEETDQACIERWITKTRSTSLAGRDPVTLSLG